jgi:HlyD family secretion protein
MTRRILIAIGIGLAAAAVAAFLWIRMNGVGPTDQLLVSGNIEAHESLVSFKAVQSRIVALPFDEGAWVESGTLLAQLDADDYRKQVDVDKAALRVQQRQLTATQENVEVARATVVNDRADLAQKRLDYDRNQKLFQENVVSADVRDLAATAFKQSAAALSRDQASLVGAQRDVEVARANIQDAEQTLELAKITLGYTTLRAPFAGVVMVREAELGEVMQPGTPVVTMADLDHIWLRAYISETDLGRVRWGQDAAVTTDTYPGKQYHGRVSFIASDAEFTPKSVETHTERVTLVYRIKIDIDNPQHELKPGMPADATIELNSVQSGNSRG